MIDLLMDKLIMVPMVLLAITFHEFAHGWASEKLGDPTPRMSGRMTLNPLSHLDPVGALLMLFTGFGWAKPVGINPRYYKNPKKGMALTALAGPISNFLLAVVAMLMYGVCAILYARTDNVAVINALVDFAGYMFMFARLNLCLMVFNFIPIPPLDGSRILGVFLSNEAYFKLQRYERYSFILIILLSSIGMFDRVIGTSVSFILMKMLEGIGLLARMVI